jgi:GTP-binding protein
MPLTINDVQFVKSSPDVRSCPPGKYPEYAFVGRSNVGKSSLINFLTGQRKLAKTSGRPGKTRLINHFLVDNTWYLVDLPGYGYARVSKEERDFFLPVIKDYLISRKNLSCLFVLIDCRHSPQKNDLDFLRWLGRNAIPFALCFTKTDKISDNKRMQYFENYKRTLLKEWEFIPPAFFTSTLDNTGRDEILALIEKTNNDK